MLSIIVKYTPGNILQANEYYPFGLQTANSWTRANTSNNFLYDGGNELNNTTGLYDLAYRNYDAALGRFHQIDPLAYIEHNLSPYHYSRNNPVGYSDPSGALDGENIDLFTDGDIDGGGSGGGWSDTSSGISSNGNESEGDNTTKSGITINSTTKNADGSTTYNVTGADGFKFTITATTNGYTVTNTNGGGTNSFVQGSDGSWAIAEGTSLLSTVTVNGLTQGVPTFQELWDNYPMNSGAYLNDKIWNAVGGKVKQNHDSNPAAFANSCTIRMSKAFNDAGYNIPFMKGQTISGADGNWYYYRVKNFDTYVTGLLGAPDITGTDISSFQGQKGIIEFQVTGWGDASGHFTLWDGSTTALGEYWNNPGLTNVKLWKLN